MSAHWPVNRPSGRQTTLATVLAPRKGLEAVGISLGGWHDFRRSFCTFQRKKGTHPKVISALMGHSRVHLAMNVYDHCDLRDFEQALMPVGNQFLAVADNSTPPSSAIQ